MRAVDLNGVWLLRELSTEKDDIPGTFEQHGNDVDWIEAHVPGVVHLDLAHSKKIPYPFYGLNELDVKWIEYKNWHCRKIFTVDEKLLSR